MSSRAGFQRLDTLAAARASFSAASAGRTQRAAHDRHVRLDGIRQALNLARVLVRRLRKRADFIGDDGEAEPVLSGACRFDGCIECQQVRLVRNAADGAGDVCDVLYAPIQFRQQCNGFALTFPPPFRSREWTWRSAPTCRTETPRGCSVRRLEDSALIARGRERANDLLDGDRLLLRCTGGLFGARGDLRHGAAELPSRGGRFGESAGELLRCCRDALGGGFPVLGGGRRLALRPVCRWQSLGRDRGEAFVGGVASFDFLTRAMGSLDAGAIALRNDERLRTPKVFLVGRVTYLGQLRRLEIGRGVPFSLPPESRGPHADPRR